MKVTDIGPGRVGFVLTNGRADMLVLEDGDKDEYQSLIRAGWRLVRLEPICRSQLPKLHHNRKELQSLGAYSYTLAILEEPRPRRALPGWVESVRPLREGTSA
jgi:hypothetical protein